MKRTIYGEDHEAFRETVSEFVAREVTPKVSDFIAAKSFSRELWRAAGKMDLLGLEIPQEYGGTDPGDYRFNAIAFEELAKAGMALPSCFGISADIVTPYLVRLTTREQRQRWLPGLCTGELVGAIAMTEPSGGSDLAALKTTARRDGDNWVINGSKTFITNGGSADLIVVATKTDPSKGARGITLFVVEEGTAGYSRGRILDKVGQEEADTAELFFDDVRVTDAEMIGEVDQGFIHLMTFLPQERLGCSVTNLAHAAHILDGTITYAGDRRAFGQSIGSLQHNKFLLAELRTQIDVAQAFLDACVVAHAAGELTPVDAAKAKWWSAQVQNDVLDHCVQIFGGYGYMNEYPVAKAWRDARVAKIWAGSNEIMKELIGREMGF